MGQCSGSECAGAPRATPSGPQPTKADAASASSQPPTESATGADAMVLGSTPGLSPSFAGTHSVPGPIPRASEGEDKVPGQMSYGGSDPESDAPFGRVVQSEGGTPTSPGLPVSQQGSMQPNQQSEGSFGCGNLGCGGLYDSESDMSVADDRPPADNFRPVGKESSISTTSSQNRGSYTSSSTSFSDVRHYIDSLADAMIAHFERFWPYYLAFLICLIVVSLMVCYRQKLRAFWKSMMGKKKQPLTQSPQEQDPEVPQDPPMGLDIV